jgi:Xaa-Pro dipeptidase
MNRTTTLKQAINQEVDIAIFNQTNILYFSGFSGASALLIPKQDQPTLYVGTVNYEQAKAETKNLEIEPLKNGENLIQKIVKQSQNKNLAIDTLPIESWETLIKATGKDSKVQLVNDKIRAQRAVKDPQEIERIQQACKIADIGIQAAQKTIKPGIIERQVAAEAEYAMRKAGSDGSAFNTIVASGYCCAYPHGTLPEKTIQEGEFVVVDLGATLRFYCSDITRTFVAGKPQDKHKQIIEAVKAAQQNAIQAIKPGAPTKEVDQAARKTIEQAGFGEFFVHNLGHGVGLEVHEAPILGPNSKDILQEGNVVTVEPGIYMPGFGGVRIEDTILVTKNGAKKLTTAPYIP